jgi:prostaglandin-E synthase
VKWAQRSDQLFITIDLPDAQDVKLKLEPEGKFFFSATSGAEKIPYEVDLDLYDKVDVNVRPKS